MPRFLPLLLLLTLLAPPAAAASDQYRETVTQPAHRPPVPETPAAGTAPSREGAFSTALSEAVPVAAQTRRREGNTFGGIALGLTVAAFIFIFIPVIGLSSVLLSLVAIVLASIGLARDRSPVMAIVALVLAIFILLLYLIAVLLLAAVL
jgi:hypothetical protein